MTNGSIAPVVAPSAPASSAPASSGPSASGPAPVQLDVGTGNRFRIEPYRDTNTGAQRFAVFNESTNQLVTMFDRGQTLELTGAGTNSIINIPPNINQQMDGAKPMIRPSEQNRHTVGIMGPHDYQAPVESVANKLAEEMQRAMQSKGDINKIQGRFEHHLTTLKDPQVAMALAVAQTKAEQRAAAPSGPNGAHDLNNIQIPGMGPLGNLMQRGRGNGGIE